MGKGELFIPHTKDMYALTYCCLVRILKEA